MPAKEANVQIPQVKTQFSSILNIMRPNSCALKSSLYFFKRLSSNLNFNDFFNSSKKYNYPITIFILLFVPVQIVIKFYEDRLNWYEDDK